MTKIVITVHDRGDGGTDFAMEADGEHISTFERIVVQQITRMVNELIKPHIKESKVPFTEVIIDHKKDKP